jgi:hypothetical protein
MRDELLNQRGPLVVFRRRGDIAAVPEDGGVSRRQRFGHEGEFDKRPHPNREEEVDNLIGVEEGIEKLFFLADERAHVVGEERMKAHMPKSEFVVAPRYLRLPVRPKREESVSASNGMLPDMGEGFGDL